MLIFYRFLINLIFIFSPLIIIFRIAKKKENFFRVKEKLGIFSRKKLKGKIIWFHGASVGEIQSIIPLIENFEKNKKISQILVTSNTLSSSSIIEKMKLKKTVHQFFPIDTNFISKKFLNYWKPSKAFFVDSEIWPNTINNLFEKKIPIILLNARITKKTFNRWMLCSNFAESLFNKFDLCLSSNKESIKYLKKLGAKNIKFFGNLKFTQSEKDTTILDKDFRNFVIKKKTWCASSTHFSEEKFCGNVHLKLKKKYKNLLTIIIPRHINRCKSIQKELGKLSLKVHLHEPRKKINPDIDIYLVNSYGSTKSFYNICKNIFLGGSLIEHGGQNPLEAIRYGCNIFHGPYISNFREIYEFLKKRKLSNKINDQNQMIKILEKFFKKKFFSKNIIKSMNLIGKKILIKTFEEVNL